MRRIVPQRKVDDSPARGGGDKVNQEKGWEEGEKKEKGEVTPPKNPPT
jgi:hypothetical protein